MGRKSFFTLLWILAVASAADGAAWRSENRPRYIIFLMADGMGADELELTRQVSLAVEGRDLFMSETLARQGYCALVDTYSSSALVTDSAAAATAWATGQKVKNGQIAVDPSTDDPLKTILEYYKEQKGFRTGIVTNDSVTGASPAAFAAHVRSRRSTKEIARQYCDESRPDVILGGGRNDFLASQRADGRDLAGDFVVRHGYRHVATAEELRRVRSGKVLGLFADGALTAHIDRAPEEMTEPTTSEMTEAALRILAADRPKGFFLFAEECNPDKAGHKNDAAAAVRGILELDRIVHVAYRFYRDHPRETLLIVTSDHECGGLQWLMGYEWLEKARAAERREGERHPAARLATVHSSIPRAASGLPEKLTPEERARLRWRYRQFQFDPNLVRALTQGRKTLGKVGDKWETVLSFLVARNTGAYYTAGAHTLPAVPLFAIGVGAERFSGHLDDTEIGRILFQLAGRQDFRSPADKAPTVRTGSTTQTAGYLYDVKRSEENSWDTLYSPYGPNTSSESEIITSAGSQKSRSETQSKSAEDDDE